MSSLRNHLLIIDPQNDFCDLPPAYCPPHPQTGQRYAPALPVAGAHADMLRVAQLIRSAGGALDAITLTLDAHQHLDIAHPGFWQGADANPVAPFTTIRAADLRAGLYQPRAPLDPARALRYLDALEASGRYTHMVWPVHCEIGTWGHTIHPDLLAACNAWEEAQVRNVTRVLKGENPWTEHYSAVMAEVPDPEDRSSTLNTSLLQSLRNADRILIAGEASSHCVKATTEHLVEHLGAEHLSKLVLLEDCMSPVTGFEAQQENFFSTMRNTGLRVVPVVTATRELLNDRV